ncbi:transposon Ty3-G Gag-Pol polyprotein [Nephila pilipes]|uniref:Transposon Ty3-G Gag-Pol polyprotein n=1 Tax=Nephila pilipes TaxID=299642 RepID=A0A8X6NCL2_NEPPI|nr:transposon Ty3-G Gag-Pol polyprotein [Nephila pilipes]
MEELKPRKSSPPRNQRIFVHKDLQTCSHVFVRVDRVKKTLEPPYEGPFTVIHRNEKYFTLLVKGKPVNISVDRLKPAHLLVQTRFLINQHFLANNRMRIRQLMTLTSYLMINQLLPDMVHR